MDGVLNVNKPSGMTSHDVVAKVRKLIKERRIGHTGTLDPLATGVLVLCVGKATRIAQYIEAGEKEYVAVMHLGTTTDTLDAEGRVLETKAYDAPDIGQVREAIQQFIGPIMQQPPAYSAIKVNGIPSYKLAREGKAEPLKPRPVTIHEIELLEYADPVIRIRVRCSKGVYIRTLCADIGAALGMGAHLTALERTRSGLFGIEGSVTLDAVAAMAEDGSMEQFLLPIDKALSDLPAVSVTEAETGRILNGNQVNRDASLLDAGSGLARIHDPFGRLLALGRVTAGMLRPEMVFS